jgi:hypothetical protein
MKILEVTERDELLNRLTNVQKDFLEIYVKRGKKTAFASTLAFDKGIMLPDSAAVEEMEMLLDEWILEDFIDNGFVNSNTPCECGKPLRYQYIVRNLSTNQIRRFGLTHFEEHTGLPASVISMIKKGFMKIDYELDELLTKIRDGWSLHDYVFDIPNDLKLPKDIQSHLDADIPLLERQLTRLKRDIRIYLDKMEEERNIRNTTYKIIESRSLPMENFEDQTSLKLFGKSDLKENPTKTLQTKLNFNDEIWRYLEEGVESTRVICELLIKNYNEEKRRYITGKPKIYFDVCQYLEQLVDAGKGLLVSIIGTEERLYKIVKKD